MKSDSTIYLDYAATTPTDTEVLQAMLPYFNSKYSNPSSLHASGRRAHAVIKQARTDIANVIGCIPEEIIFTGSGTESNNLAILGVARANRPHGDHIIISAIEHKAVLESARVLENEGFTVSILPVNMFGRIDVETCIQMITEKTTLISVMYANNEIGTIEPIRDLATAIKNFKGDNFFPLLHTDACQACGYLSVDVRELGVDLMTLNGSKIYGPKGVGMLYRKNEVRISPIIVGGEQEGNLRAGTESVPLIVGFATAIQKINEGKIEEAERLTILRDYFIRELQSRVPSCIINGDLENRLPNNIHVSVPNIEGESILLMLDNNGIEVSTGSACSSPDLEPSHVLLAIGQTPENAHGSVRFSLGKNTTKAELDTVLLIFVETVERLMQMSALRPKS